MNLLRSLLCSRDFKSVALVLALFLSFAALAQETGQVPEGQSNQGRQLKLGLSFSIPPWVIREEDSGLKLEIIRKAFEVSGYQIKPVYVPNSRAYKLFEQKQIDAVLSPSKPVTNIGYLSEPVTSFHNVAISLKKKGFPKDIPISFLSDKSVVAFQKAHQFLGAEFGEIAGHNANYEEITQQHLQVNLLFVREVDFIVMDRSVFGYFWKKAVEQEYPGDERFLQEVQVHELFSKSIYHYLFLEKAVRDQFDLGLKKIREQGVYDQLVKQYAKAFQEYRPTAPATP